ncbi:uncharacterized protein LOC129600410 isoform X2 [Paramacrobiotus metropolitanus]|uniref:uncharacterized protein LOC129600410 isoform X2 n=1 Tax=Paramacrobiotus metropolitanus TaxID=2943436 RepID=UPI0024462677|nr:uncharacterized protein LOC129600410 isoform X2 [Paramacrobiotus metropolitanus]
MERKWLTSWDLKQLSRISVVQIILGVLATCLIMWKGFCYSDYRYSRFVLARAIEYVSITEPGSAIIGQHAIMRSRSGKSPTAWFLAGIVLNVSVLTVSIIAVFMIIGRLLSLPEELVLDDIMWLNRIIPIALGLLTIIITYCALRINVRCFAAAHIDKALSMVGNAAQECRVEMVANETPSESHVQLTLLHSLPPPTYEDVINAGQNHHDEQEYRRAG